MWGDKDSNLGTRKRTDLQSVVVGHLTISPKTVIITYKEHLQSRRRESNPRPTDYKSVALPAELLRQLLKPSALNPVRVKNFHFHSINSKNDIIPPKKGRKSKQLIQFSKVQKDNLIRFFAEDVIQPLFLIKRRLTTEPGLAGKSS